MDAARVLEEFIRISGRKDLESPDSSGVSRAYGFINQAQIWLDDHLEHPGLLLRHPFKLEPGESVLYLERLRYVDWIRILDQGNWREVGQVEAEELLYRPKSMHPGAPRWYAHHTGVLDPSIVGFDPEEWEGSEGILAEDSHGKDLLIFAPAPSETHELELHGAFYSKGLQTNNDTSFWTRAYPHLLIETALYHLEVSYRNTQGANDWMESIQRKLMSIEKNIVNRELSHGNRTMMR